jgi:hypothetical protein
MLLSKSNKIFNKIMTNYRKGHIIKILDTFDKANMDIGTNVPLDLYIRKYFLGCKTVSSSDREFIYDQVYNLIRYRGLLDFISRPPVDWEKRFEEFYSENFNKQLENVNLPS